LPELSAAIEAAKSAIVLLEVRSDNFQAALNLLSESWRHNTRFVALLGEGLEPDQATESLFEAGALAVIRSPRRISAVIELARRLAASTATQAKMGDAAESIVNRAWASLPWQDA
jgi:hypothetical protein